MRCHINPIGCLFALVAACAPASGAAATAIDTGGACLNWRWIGVQSDPGACPSPAGTGWRTSKLFAIEGATPTPALRRFCRYEDPAGNAPASALTALVGNGLSRVDRDCVAVSPQAQLAAIQWPVLNDWLRAQAGATISGLLGNTRVRLAVIDSSPTNAVDPVFDVGASPHGNALITIAERLLCDSHNQCATGVTSQLALDFLRVNPNRQDPGDVDEIDGGYVGSIADLARAIHAEVVAWRNGPASHLILNLSVAWGPEFGGLEANIGDMPAGVQAVNAALIDASCRGALTLAAAGNRSGGIAPELGPMLPSAWELRAAPTAPECLAALGGAGAIAPNTFAGSYRALVYAVSGIESDGAALDNIRAGSQARLAAFGDHGVTESALGPIAAPTATLTGTSVATLLASLNAAVAWSWNPGWSAHEAIEQVHDAATGTPSELARVADFCLGAVSATTCAAGASRTVHRLSLCETRLHVGPVILGAACTWDRQAAQLSNEDYSEFDASATLVDLATLAVSLMPPECRGAVVHVDAAGAASGNYCPHRSLPSIGAQPWVYPQPGSDLCPECSLDLHENAKALAAIGLAKASPEDSLRIELSDEFIGEATDITLVVGNQLYRLYTGAPMRAGARLHVVGLQRLNGNLGTATLAMRVNGNYSTLGPLLRDSRP